MIVRAFLLLLVLPVFPVLPVAAQSVRVAGTVITADSTPVRGARVVLHQIGSETQGPLDSTRADQSGRFRFAFRPDTATFYLLSARRSGIEYFSPPLSTNPTRPDTAVSIVVYDTSSTAPVAVEARHLVLTRPDSDGSRNALDLIVLQNGGRRTRVAPDTLRPSVTLPLPPGTAGLQVGESEVSTESVRRRGDSLMITAPIAPGEKQITVQYRVLPGRTTVELPVQRAGQKINVLLEETGARVSGAGMTFADSQVIQGRSFRRWTGVTTIPGAIRIALPGTPRAAASLLVALVVALGVTLLGAGWYLLSRQSRQTPLPVDDLLDAIAALDARYLGRKDETPAAEWSSYLGERARLKTRLAKLLVFVFAWVVLACGRTPAQRGAIQLIDDAGDTLRLASPARRVVSLIPATTELLFAIGADSAVVGRTSYCDYPAAAKAVPDLGDGIKPSIEAVVSHRPDLVILYNSGQNAAVAGRLRELGIAAIRLNTDALSDVGRVSKMLGRLTGHQRGADSVNAVFDTALAAATRPPQSNPPKVLLLVWEQPPMTIGRGSFLSELVERAGGENLFADVTASSGVVSIEAVAARNPDLIFTTIEGPSSFASHPEWQVVPAVREHRFLQVSGSEFNRPSPRAPAAIRQLAARLSQAGR